MIIRRQLYPNNKESATKLNDSGMELKPIYKKIAQPNPDNKLLHTAAAATNVIQDVDTLLTPIQQPKKHRDETSSQQQSQTSKERTERNLWRIDEIMEMLSTMQQVKALEKLNDKTVKSENVFKDVEVIMHRNGFVKKSHVQIWTKWKFLKSSYMTSRRNGVIPRMIPPQVYETIHQMITGLNQSLADSSNSTNCSVDGDTSNASGMVISGVEGGVSDIRVTNGDDDDSFGMAHPIFGFRLGMVKSEPADTGYENVEKNISDKDPLVEELSHSKSNNQVKDENKNTEKKANNPEPVKKVLEIPHRGRGRPPKNLSAAASKSNNTLTSAIKDAQMPPLRVAPFARALTSANAIAANRPPPPLTMPPTPRIRIANLSNVKNQDPVNFAQPKLMPKPTVQQQSPPVQSIRLSKEVSMQTRVSNSPSPSYPKMKQIPMRKTPYSLRPDRAIPDLEASLSPPPPAIEKPYTKKLEEIPTTKHLTMKSNPESIQNGVHRKRRSEWQDTMPSKHPKYIDNNEDSEENISKTESVDDGKHYGKALQNVIIDLSSSLRKMQTQMMRDFFNKQNELLEREHKFQLQQDRLILKAFQEQTQEIMNSIKLLVGTIKTNKKDQLFKRGEQAKKLKSNRKEQVQKKQIRSSLTQKNNGKEMIKRHVPANRDQEQDEEELIKQLVQANRDHEEQDNDEQQLEQETEEVYSYSEEQQNQMEEQDESDQEESDQEENDQEEENDEEIESNDEPDDEQCEDNDLSQSSDSENDNEISEEHDNDLHDTIHNPTCMISSELNGN